MIFFIIFWIEYIRLLIHFQMMPNLTVDHKGNVKVQKTTLARTMDDAEETYKLLQLPKEESKMSLLGNLFLSEGRYECFFFKQNDSIASV